MKTMILNLSFVYRKLRSANSLFLILIFNTFTSHQLKAETIEEKWIFYSKQNNALEYSNDSVYFIIIKNNKSCLNCFQTLTEYLKIAQNNSLHQLHAASYSDSISLSRKRNIYELTQLFPEFHKHAVTYSELWNEKITTPELLIIKNDKQYRFKYEELFADGFSIISFSVQSAIKSILIGK